MSQKTESLVAPEGYIDVYLSKKVRAALLEEYGSDWERMLVGPKWIDMSDYGLRGRFKDSSEFAFFLLKAL